MQGSDHGTMMHTMIEHLGTAPWSKENHTTNSRCIGNIFTALGYKHLNSIRK